MRGVELKAGEPDLGGGIYGLSHGPAESLIHLVSVPFEATCSYGGGTADGPNAILRASPQLDLFDFDFGAVHRVGIYAHPEDPRLRALNERARPLAEPVLAVLGEVAGHPELVRARDAVNDACAQVNDLVESHISELLARGHWVGMIGGDHATAFGSIAAHARRHPGLGILHLDAHADLRTAYEGFTWSHASIMGNVLERLPGVARLVQVAIRDLCEEEVEIARAAGARVCMITDRELQRKRHDGISFRALADEIVASLPALVYLSFDIDGLDPALCPHTGTPVPGGLDFAEMTTLLLALVESGRTIVGLDLVEVAPGPVDEWDGNVGARVLYKMLGAMLATRSSVLRVGPATRDRR